MNVNEIVQQLKDERSGLNTAIQALEGIGGSAAPAKRRGRPPGTTNKATGTHNQTTNVRKKRTMSAAARKRISEMMRKRWAESKRAKK
jgi:hypothetical protein